MRNRLGMTVTQREQNAFIAKERKIDRLNNNVNKRNRNDSRLHETRTYKDSVEQETPKTIS